MIISGKNNLPLYSQWDANNDSNADTSPSSAVSLQDASGTFRSYTLLRQFDSLIEKQSGQITLTVIGKDYSTATIFTCSATYWLGATRDWGDTPITTDATWDSFNDGGLLNGFHDYLAGTITNGSAFNFAKLTFAQNEGYTNGASLEITFEISISNGLSNSVNTDNDSENDRDATTLTLYIPNGIKRLNSDIDIVFTGLQSTNERSIKEYHRNRGYSKSKHLTLTTTGIRSLEIDSNNPSDTYPTMYYSLARETYMTRVTGYDSDDMPNFDTPTDLLIEDTIGALPPTALGIALYGTYTNDMPDLFHYSHLGAYPTRFCRNGGTYASPDYNDLYFFGYVPLAVCGDWYGIYSYHIHVDSSQRCWVLWNLLNQQIHRISILEFTGATLTDPLDWTATPLMYNSTVVATTAPSGGNGQTACINDMFHMVLNEADVVNGYPTIYLAGRHVIMRGRHNGGTAGDETDWTYEVVVGVVDTSGYVNDNGTSARLNDPRDLSIYDNTLYFGDAGNRIIRQVNVDSASGSYLDVTDYLGVKGVATNLDATVY